MDRIRAPYNFVPLSPEVCRARDLSPALCGENLERVHDLPFRDGIDATIEYAITAETPIFVRGGGGGGGAEAFFTAPDGTRGIPGSGVRGAIRNVLEIASFGRLSRVNDHVYGVRDLHNRKLYGDHMAELLFDPKLKKNVPTPLVSAGWMRRVFPPEADGDEDDPVVAEIIPCDFFKVHYRDLIGLAASHKLSGFNPGRKQSAAQKYQAWNATRDVSLKAVVTRPRGGRSKAAKVPFLGDYGLIRREGDAVDGVLVFTGQPSEWNERMAPKARGAGNPKQHDFVFHPRPEAIPAGEVRRFRVRRSEFERFEFIHADTGQQGRAAVTPNEEWGFWRKPFARGEHVPVFLLPRTDGSLRSFGLAMMFRLAYDLSVRDAVRNGQPQSDGGVTLDELDLAEAIFGTVPLDAKRDEEERGGSLKGRVSFGFAACAKARVLSPVRAVLGAPKATYYPSYIEQASDPVASPAAQPSSEYRTLMNADAVVRGWKRYRPHPSANERPPIPAKSKESVQTKFAPLAAGAVFRGTLRVHNLRPEELGALVWCTRFGGDPKARHLFGMARSLGYGRARFVLGEASTEIKTHGGEALTLDECEARFVSSMERWAGSRGLAGGWAQSEPIRQLIACARPVDDARQLRSMQLEHPEFRNEFAAAKKQMLSLEPAADTVVLKAGAARTRDATRRRSCPTATMVGTIVTPSIGARGGHHDIEAQVAGRIVRFANNRVVIKLSDGREVSVALSVDVFEGFRALNGNELKRDRAVSVQLEGTRAVKVRAV